MCCAVFLLLHPVEERKGAREGWYSGVRLRETSVFPMSSFRNVSFCDEARLLGRICMIFASAWSVRPISDQIGLVWSWGSVFLFPDSVYEAEMGAEQGMFDDGSDPIIMACVWSSALLLNAVTLPVETLSCRWATEEGCDGIPRDLYWRITSSASTLSLSTELRSLALISSLSCWLHSKVWDVIFGSECLPGSS